MYLSATCATAVNIIIYTRWAKLKYPSICKILAITQNITMKFTAQTEN